MEVILDPYRRGFRDRRSGADVGDNPYARGSEDSALWLKGWVDQHEHLSKRDEALKSVGYGI